MSKFLLQEPGSSTARPRVLIVEDHAMLAEALALSLSARGYDCSVARLDGPESVLSQAASQRPALVLLDLDLGNTDGLDLLPGLGPLAGSARRNLSSASSRLPSWRCAAGRWSEQRGMTS